ncbi:MAG: C13 family peptidase [Chloroflexota bacterium]
MRFAITNWAVERVSDRQRLTIYMVSHGNRDEFYLDMLHGELLTPHDLDQWLTELEIAVPGLKSNIIIEASHSGSFIEPNNEGERNSISGENRVIITSSDPNYDAYTSHYGMHFTDNFLSKLVQGISLAGSFQAGYTIVESLYVPQSPWLDANSNGQPNEREDYSIAEAHGFRFEDSLGQNWSPFIAQVSPPTNIVDRRGRIYAEVRDNKGVDEVWAVIYPPDYVPPVADGELNREIQDIVLLQRTSGSDTNGDYYGDYLGFAEPGVYRILIHARDRDDMQAQPVMMTVQVSNDTLTPTSTSTDTPVQSTSTFTPMPTNTPTHTPTNVPTSMPTIPETNTSTPTMTPMPTNIPSPTMTPSSTFTPSPTPAPQDDYESDNTCDLARSIQPSGIPQSHTFHTAGDTDWATFTAPTSGVYRIEVTVPSGSPADVDLYYYTDCNAFHRSQFVGTHAPGARIDVTVDEDEVGTPYYIKIKHFDPLQFGPNVIYNLSVRPLPPERDEEGDLIIPGAAIIVAGRYSYVDTVQDNIDQTALAAYNLFHGKGRNHSEIFFLATNSTLPHVDGEATLRNLEIGIKDEARRHLQKENVSQVLSLYLVDHGGPNEFYLDRPNEEVLTPDHLHNWLTDLEEEFPDLLVNVFIEACNAGSFITPNGGSISKDNRVIITSSDEDYDAYTSLRGTLFSDNFLSFLGQEHNLAYSFETSMRIVQEHHDSQEPWIDANGNGIPNELEDMSKASLRSFADSWTLGSEWPPYIADVQPMMHTRSDVTHLHAEVRHEFDNGAIDDVWAVVYPPSYTADTEEPSSNGDGGSDGLLNSDTLDVIEFSAESDDAKALFVGAYADFTEMGVYQIVVHALDNKGLHAQPVTVALDTMALYGHQIFLPTVSR